jgi:hypothetical protein
MCLYVRNTRVMIFILPMEKNSAALSHRATINWICDFFFDVFQKINYLFLLSHGLILNEQIFDVAFAGRRFFGRAIFSLKNIMKLNNYAQSESVV